MHMCVYLEKQTGLPEQLFQQSGLLRKGMNKGINIHHFIFLMVSGIDKYKLTNIK